MYDSSFTIVLSISVTTYLIIWYVLRINPFHTLSGFVRDLLHNRTVLIHFVAMLAILLFNKIELLIEKMMDVKNDFTPLIYQFEGDFVLWIQKYFQNEVLTFILTYFYVIVFTALLIASLLIYHYSKDHSSFYALCYGIMMNYMIAIPFFLFFPVNEVWYHHPDVRFLILDVYPGFESGYRNLSGIDNCFPSLHTSLSLTMAFIAIKSKHPRFGRIVMFSALVIIFSIFYLGIHWLADMTAGSLLAMFIVSVAFRLAENGAPSRVSLATRRVR
ncbi:MAG: phosphatase PAP2 family protein [Bacillaceae bacterium]|nr:phosphatase PAP2 family protein [Bacillaceae bacterium]